MSRRTTPGMRALWAASAAGGLGQSLAGAAGALLARAISGSAAVAGLPQTMLVIGSAVAAVGLSALTRRRGRRVGLATGALVALAGCAVVAGGAVAALLPLVLVGSGLLGAGNTAVMLGRYAAADLAPEISRARAMASVLTATTVGAVAGPNLLLPASRFAAGLGLPPLTGPYLGSALAFAAAAGTLAFGLRPLWTAAAPSVDPAPPASRRLDPDAVTGLAVLGLANLVMITVMTMAPLQLHHIGGGLGVVGLVVSLHIAGMFAPSAASGWLTDRVGAARAASGAGLLLVAASLLAAAEAGSPALLGGAMVLLGVGWNLGLISGSSLLTAAVPAAERPWREGRGEVGMGVAAAGGGAMSGAVMAGAGYSVLAAGAAVFAALLLPAAGRPAREPAAAGLAQPTL